MKALERMRKFIQEIITDFKISSDNDALKKLMAEGSLAPLILSLAGCTIFSMLVTAVYNTADTYFVSQLGVSASAAVGVIFSVMAMIQAIGFTMGMGAASCISRAIGASEYKEANIFASTSFFLSFFLATLLAIIGLCNLQGFVTYLGSTPTILPYAMDYARYILLGAPFMASSFVMNAILRSEGHATYALMGIGLGGILNMILDPICIFAIGWGTKGAAIATAFSQFVSFSILLYFFLCKKSIVHIAPKYLKIFSRKTIYLFTLGFPSTLRQGLMTASCAILNIIAATYGDATIAAMSIVTRIVMFLGSAIIGLGQGMCPVIGFNYGLKKYHRVLEAYFTTMKFGFYMTIVSSCFVLAFAPEIISIFRSDPDVVNVGAFTLRCQVVFILCFPIMVFTNMLAQFLGYATSASFLASLNHGLIFVPVILILPKCFGLLGLEITQAITDTITLLIYIPFIIYYVKYLQSLEKGINKI